jgi:pantoate kinase
MMKHAKAFSPCHITGFFQICDEYIDPLHVGSRGAGVSLSQGVTTTVKIEESSASTIEIRINGETPNHAEVSQQVADELILRSARKAKFAVSIEHRIDVPIGAGFGTSGAAALSLALSLNEALGLNLSEVEAAQIAHVAEVRCGTGLGTVAAESYGGVEIRTKPGAPGIGDVKRIASSEDIVVACMSFGSLSTRKLLADPQTRRRVNELGGRLVDQLVEKSDCEEFLKLSREFAEHVGLISRKIRRVLDATDGASFLCSMPMFGESVFTLIERESLNDLLRVFDETGTDGQIIVSNIALKGALNLNDTNKNTQ